MEVIGIASQVIGKIPIAQGKSFLLATNYKATNLSVKKTEGSFPLIFLNILYIYSIPWILMTALNHKVYTCIQQQKNPLVLMCILSHFNIPSEPALYLESDIVRK